MTAASPYIERILKARVYDVAIGSPLEEAARLSRRLGNQLLLKREDLQAVFSFKLRGAYNRIAHLSEERARRGVVCGGQPCPGSRTRCTPARHCRPDAALKARAEQDTSLYDRGVARRLKADTVAGDADLKAALVVNAHLATTFADYGVKP